MADFSKIAGLLPLFNKLDTEAIALFVQYGQKALNSGNPTEFVKRTMRAALSDVPVQAEFITEEAKPRRPSRS